MCIRDRVIDNLVKKRVIFDRTLHSDAFTTVQRKGNVHEIKLIADQDLLKDYDIRLDQNYLFLSVEKAKPKEGDIDVLLDPYGMNTDLTYVPDEGNKGNGITEYKDCLLYTSVSCGNDISQERCSCFYAWESGWHRVQYVPERERFFVP